MFYLHILLLDSLHPLRASGMRSAAKQFTLAFSVPLSVSSTGALSLGLRARTLGILYSAIDSLFCTRGFGSAKRDFLQALPSSVSNRYFLWILTHGSSCRR